MSITGHILYCKCVMLFMLLNIFYSAKYPDLLRGKRSIIGLRKSSSYHRLKSVTRGTVVYNYVSFTFILNFKVASQLNLDLWIAIILAGSLSAKPHHNRRLHDPTFSKHIRINLWSRRVTLMWNIDSLKYRVKYREKRF